ncbi:hypothetical protein L6164_007364 [Bauhinia variegata]|uniref:Uncharacterized protein n=1 Tax=Bauhinia variegata TaxID=167791 RepID=A0ACB9PD87_BAUVA|nr:hypothetical protein L6164_007364 [Bauhinia variegata]
MEAAEELASGPNEQTHIAKGKRTKRVRPQSPIPVFNSSNQDHGEAEDDFHNVDKDDNFDKTSPATTSSTRNRDSTEEEEDMANCLILLAQGQSRESPKPAEEDDNVMNCTKFSSRRFMEAASLGSGKAGFYVYECKTCNKTFPSFQALGGHRTSHKKPKAIAALMAIDNDKKQLLFSSDEDEFKFKNNNRSNPFSLQMNRGNLCSNNSKPKVHECSICGAEFTSGQALGGHMRRHRATIGTNTTLSLSPMALEPEQQQPRKKRNVLSLDLDLNLPAPEDDQTESKFAFASKQQQQQQEQQQHQASLVFSAPALVDCHY